MSDLLPPPEVTLLVDALDEAGALRVVEAFAGRRLYVPVKLKAGGDIVRALGPELGRALTKHFGGDAIAVPLAREWRCVIYRHRYKWTVAQIAGKLGVTEATVYKNLTRHQPETATRQLNLL